MASKERGEVNRSSRPTKKAQSSVSKAEAGRTANYSKDRKSGKNQKKNTFDFKSAAASIISKFSDNNVEEHLESESVRKPKAQAESAKKERIGQTLSTSQMDPYEKPIDESDSMHSGEKKRQSRHQAETYAQLGQDGSHFVQYLKTYLKRTWVKVMLAVMVVFLLMYASYQAYLRYYSDIKTEIASISTYSETIDTEAIAVRDEIIIDKMLSGTSVSTVANGGKVSKDQTIINMFESSEAAEAYTRIAEIENEIAELQSMATASEDSAAEVGNIKKQIDGQISNLAKSVNASELGEVSEIKSNITYLMNKRLIAMRKVEDYQSRIDKLTKEKTSLENSYNESPAQINSPQSGYYVNTLDGYENLLNTSMLPELTAEKLDSIMKQKAAVPENSAGKLITDFSWYLVCPVSAEVAEDYLAVQSVYTLILPYSETGSIKGTLVYLNEGEGDKLLAVFKCYSLLSELCTIRSQPVKIQIRSYTGFSVKKSALHVYHDEVEVKDENGKVTGHKEVRYPCVYVIVGNQVVQRRVNVVYNGDKFAICSSNNAGNGYLSLYDKVITEGKGLYAGKIIN